MNETKYIATLAGLITAALWLGHVPPDIGHGQSTQPATESQSASPASSDMVIQQLMQKRREGPPMIAPAPPHTDETGIEGLGSSPNLPDLSLGIDPAIIGVAPGDELPPLQREGSFIVNRRGRLVHTPSGHQVFVFEADAKHSPELPMVLQPSRMLESMEDITAQRSRSTIFILSGQIHTYRGMNYLLPTMMKIAIPKGNLETES